MWALDFPSLRLPESPRIQARLRPPLIFPPPPILRGGCGSSAPSQVKPRSIAPAKCDNSIEPARKAGVDHGGIAPIRHFPGRDLLLLPVVANQDRAVRFAWTAAIPGL